MEDRRARGEEHEKCDQTAKQLAKRSVCEGASEAGCMTVRSRTVQRTLTYLLCEVMSVELHSDR